MREYIAKRLGEMKNLEAKEDLRDVLEQVFLPLYDQTMTSYKALEERVENEIQLDQNYYTVYGTLLPKEKADRYCTWLFPILTGQVGLEQEADQPIMRSIIDEVFIEADYLTIKEIIRSNQRFYGEMETQEGSISAEVRLQPNIKYRDKVRELYTHFINNGVPWVTLDLPYIFKMFDVVLCSDLPENSEIKSWSVDFGKYNTFIKKGLVPVWNVSDFIAESNDFPIPIIDKKAYEYHFDLDKYGTENGYLADYYSAPISSSRREKETFIVVALEKKDTKWKMIRFSNPRDEETVLFNHSLLSNKKRVMFADKLILQNHTKVNTKAEIVRVIESFDMGNYIKFENLSVVNNQHVMGETYECNFFLEDEIRDENISKTMILQFSKNTINDTYLLRDIMSFITSNIQLIYPEYHCVGALL